VASIYDDMQELASELLTADDDNFGQSKTGNVINILVKTVTGTGSTDLDEDTITWPATQVKAVSRGVDAKRDGEGMRAMADRLFIVEGDGVTQPTLEDKMEEAGLEYAIVKSEAVSNDGTVAIYKVYAKR
jgi:hypothetical protein